MVFSFITQTMRSKLFFRKMNTPIESPMQKCDWVTIFTFLLHSIVKYRFIVTSSKMFDRNAEIIFISQERKMRVFLRYYFLNFKYENIENE